METRDKAIGPDARSLLRPGRFRAWRRAVLVALAAILATLVGAVLYGAYVYQPLEAGRGYRQPYLEEVRSRFVETPVARFRYVRAGSGSPVVLVSPGAAWVVAWKHQLRALSENHTVYVVDLPGQGYTKLKDPDDFRWNLAGMTELWGASWTPCT